MYKYIFRPVSPLQPRLISTKLFGQPRRPPRFPAWKMINIFRGNRQNNNQADTSVIYPLFTGISEAAPSFCSTVSQFYHWAAEWVTGSNWQSSRTVSPCTHSAPSISSSNQLKPSRATPFRQTANRWHSFLTELEQVFMSSKWLIFIFSLRELNFPSRKTK